MRLEVEAAQVRVGERVVLTQRAGRLVVATQQSEAIGVPVGDSASVLEDCLAQGFIMEGQVQSVHSEEGIAVVVVHGIPPDR